METFRHMVNYCIRIGLQHDVSTLKKLSIYCYHGLEKYDVISYYKLHAISKAAGILANRKQSIKRGYPTKTPHLKKGILVSCYGFKIVNGIFKAVDIAENTRYIVRSFKPNDVRIRKKIASKYGRRRYTRINQLLHHVSKQVVARAKDEKTAIAFEKLTYIRRMYQKGNYQGKNYRSKLNGWSFAEIKRLITYKAQWEGVPVIQLTSGQTRGTSQLCPRCGKRIQEAGYRDVIHRRLLWCDYCKRWMDRDVVAAMNIARKGAAVFQRSQGLAGEAMKGNPTTPVILRVDASKLAFKARADIVNRTYENQIYP